MYCTDLKATSLFSARWITSLNGTNWKLSNCLWGIWSSNCYCLVLLKREKVRSCYLTDDRDSCWRKIELSAVKIVTHLHSIPWSITHTNYNNRTRKNISYHLSQLLIKDKGTINTTEITFYCFTISKHTVGSLQLLRLHL